MTNYTEALEIYQAAIRAAGGGKMKRKTWKSKLTKKELAHLRETGARTLADVRANVAHQDGMLFPCWECIGIARKLGIPCTTTTFDKRD